MTVSGPLAGITVVDLTRVLAGPYCTMMLHDLGAQVIKVENPQGGDDARAFGPFIDGHSAYFMSINRGKQSIALDLKSPPDREILERLLAHADIVVENFRAGTMEKLGYGWDSLHARYPRLIYAAASGFGHTGPYADRPAYDMVVQGMGGIMSLTGHPGGPPTRVGSSIGDITAGLFTAIGIGAALYHREKTGAGVKIDVSMLDCQAAILENAIVRYSVNGEIPQPMGARHPSITPFEAYASQDGHVIIAAGNDKLFHHAADALGLPELKTDPRFLSGPLRNQNVEALKICFEAALRGKPTAHWLERLHALGVPSGPINNVAQMLADPQIRARNMVVSAPDKSRGTLQIAGNPIKLSAFADPSARGPTPDLDGDRARILGMIDGIKVERRKASDAEWMAQFVTARNGSTFYVSKGKTHEVCDLPGFIARDGGAPSGLATYDLAQECCELVSLDSLRKSNGIGSALLDAVTGLARSEGCTRLWTLVGNDNLDALGFLQRRGFHLVAVHQTASSPPGSAVKNNIARHSQIELECRL